MEIEAAAATRLTLETLMHLFTDARCVGYSTGRKAG